MRELVDDLYAGRWGQEASGNEIMGKGIHSSSLVLDEILCRIVFDQVMETEIMQDKSVDLRFGEITPIAIFSRKTDQPASWDLSIVIFENSPIMSIYIDVWRLDRVASHLNLLKERLPKPILGKQYIIIYLLFIVNPNFSLIL